MNDVVKGTVTVRNDQFDDFILARTDGTPVYNFNVVVDDIDMRIDHVIRGADHHSNTPFQLAIYRALEFWPFQSLVYGDPLTRPFAIPPLVTVSGVPAQVSDVLTLTPKAVAQAPGASISPMPS